MPNKLFNNFHVGNTDTQRAKVGSKSRPQGSFKQATPQNIGTIKGVGTKNSTVQNTGNF